MVEMRRQREAFMGRKMRKAFRWLDSTGTGSQVKKHLVHLRR